MSSSYSSNGVQINRPEDGEIAQSILENLEPWSNAWNDLQPSEYLHADAYEKIIVPYKQQVKEFAVSELPRIDFQCSLLDLGVYCT